MGDFEMPEQKETEEEALESADQVYHPYLKQELNLHIIFDNTVYQSANGFIPLVAHLIRYDKSLGTFYPILYPSDFWVLMRDLVLVDKESVDRIRKVKAGER